MGAIAAAAFTVFNLTYSGALEGNTAVATGQITLDTAALLDNAPFSSVVSGLSLTVAGASVGNGTFGLTDYSELSFYTDGVTLDFNSELVGQGGGWGDTVGGFDLFADFGTPTLAPTGSGPNTLRTGGM